MWTGLCTVRQLLQLYATVHQYCFTLFYMYNMLAQGIHKLTVSSKLVLYIWCVTTASCMHGEQEWSDMYHYIKHIMKTLQAFKCNTNRLILLHIVELSQPFPVHMPDASTRIIKLYVLMVVMASMVTEKDSTVQGMSQYIMFKYQNTMTNCHILHKPCVNEYDCHQGDCDCHNHSNDNTTCYETNLDRGGTNNCSKQDDGKDISWSSLTTFWMSWSGSKVWTQSNIISHQIYSSLYVPPPSPTAFTKLHLYV